MALKKKKELKQLVCAVPDSLLKEIDKWALHRRTSIGYFVETALLYYFAHNDLCEHDKCYDRYDNAIEGREWICRKCKKVGLTTTCNKETIASEFEKLLSEKNREFELKLKKRQNAGLHKD